MQPIWVDFGLILFPVIVYIIVRALIKDKK
jgi:hypothetical protein